MRCDVFAYDYSGYGQSSGSPSEYQLNADIDAAYHYLVHESRAPRRGARQSVRTR